MRFRRLLVANRGEIACRVFRTARRLGMECIAVYSDADADAKHVREADRAVRIGPALPLESYLCIDRIMDAIGCADADIIHPGYGFLAENPDFADRLERAGIAFAGPPSDVMRLLGDKAAARQCVAKAGVPVIPGFDEATDDGALASAAERIGFPIMVKAAAGGGGRGIRRVDAAAALAEAVETCRREAHVTFGDDRLLLEQCVSPARHLEVQVLADNTGETIHLFERDCSAQRRHQKIIEEAPAPNLSAPLAEAMREAAIRAAKAARYRGAGTVEFLVPAGDDSPDAFLFMEMNARLQVEHPVTEAVTGIDLVEWQLRIAADEPLANLETPATIAGHAIEARLCAEDPANDFQPSPGRILRLRLPSETDSIRTDSGVDEGDEIPVAYDSMIAKIIAHGANRAKALKRLLRALESTRVAGPATNSGFLHITLDSESFRAGNHDTSFLANASDALLEVESQPPPEVFVAAALIQHRRALDSRQTARAGFADPHSPFAATDGWRIGRRSTVEWPLQSGDRKTVASVDSSSEGWRVQTDLPDSPAGGFGNATVCGERVEMRSGDKVVVADVLADGEGEFQVWVGANTWRIRAVETELDPTATAIGGGDARAPLPGRVLRFHVREGDKVERGAPLATMEAMKTEHVIRAPSGGRVRALACAAGDLVEEGSELVLIQRGDSE